MPVSYRDFRTGLQYRTVRGVVWSPDPDPATWRYKGRSAVLGLWRQFKQEMYAQYVGQVMAGLGSREVCSEVSECEIVMRNDESD